VTIAHEARARLDALAKPQSSLGRLEDLAVRLAETQSRLDPKTTPRRCVLFAGDHGVVASGVGIWPQAVTTAMIHTIASGRATSSALARATNTELIVVDVGSCAPPHVETATLLDRRAGRRGTADLSQGSAMSIEVLAHAFDTGASIADEATFAGIDLLCLGEMGIGNTTSAAALIAYFTGRPAKDVVGDGAGATPETRARKLAIVASAVDRARAMPNDREAIASLAGYEIAAMAGAIVRASYNNLSVVLDGVVVAAAALIARAFEPEALKTSIASHVGAEPAHRIALEALGLQPFLDWKLRLGEGSGALLLVPMLDAAAALLTEVATLSELAPKDRE
jgi:nicotinate-nucleotide--dimethylbenzimidazole phosphoribosyltransferase